MKLFGYPLMPGELAAVVCGDGLQHLSLVRQWQPPYGLCQRLGLLPMLSFSMIRKLVLLSVSVRMALLSLSTMRSIFQIKV